MRYKIATSIEQSKILVNAGLNPETANMTWVRQQDLPTNEWHWHVLENRVYDRTNGLHVCPAWSLEALMAVMPNEIHGHYKTLRKGLSRDWEVCYYDFLNQHQLGWSCQSNQPVNAAVQMVLTLLLEWKIELNQDVKFHYSEQ